MLLPQQSVLGQHKFVVDVLEVPHSKVHVLRLDIIGGGGAVWMDGNGGGRRQGDVRAATPLVTLDNNWICLW